MRTSRAHVLLAVGAMALAAACGSSDDNDTNANPTPSAGPATYAVQVDANRADLNLPATEFALAYYPKALSVHPGDTVSFGLNDSGEPHTVALGSLVDAVAVPYSKLTPAQRQGPPPAALQAASKKVPQLLPDGPGDAFQSAAQPCYQATGAPPLKDACAVHTGDFAGTEALVSSGWLDANAPFTLKISDSAKAGTYHFYCQLHGPDMGGTLTIADKATTIPSPAEAKTSGDNELKADTAKLSAAAAQLPKGTARHALAGAFSQTFQNGAVAAFGPSNIKIPVGGSVTWAINGPHAIYFNAPTDAQQLRVAAPDGSVHFNPKAAMPVGGPGAPQKAGLFNGGSWNGVGPHSSGAIISFPPDLFTYRLTFTKAGTFNYICTFHTNMKGTVTVG
jgi:plastocyanin